MRVAAYQAPYLPFGSMDAVGLVKEQLATCEAERVEILCCPEAVLGGLAHESEGQSPADVAISVADGELGEVVAPLLDTSVSVIIGFTERDASDLYNSAVLLANGEVAAVYRKVYPGYRTVLRPGNDLPTFTRGSTTFGIIICNDIWYLEPSRVLAAAGAAVIFVPTNSGHRSAVSDSFRARGDNLAIARAVENTTTVIVSDIAGRQGDRLTCGFTAIIDPDGVVVAKAEHYAEQLLIADVPSHRRAFDPRGWDGYTNPHVADAFVQLWTTDRR